MDSNQQQEQADDFMEMEVPEIHGDLLVELLDDVSLAAAENAGCNRQQLGPVADVDVDGDGDCWIDSQENDDDDDIHAHQDCEDCGLDDGMLLPPDIDEHGSSSRLRSPSPAPPYPYVVFDHDDDTLELEWAETADAGGLDPFASACAGDWYMGGVAMAMAAEWEELDGGSAGGFPFEPCYGSGDGEAEPVYASSPLWE